MRTDLSHGRTIAHESVIFASRLFIQWRRYPMVPMQSLLFPTLLLIIYSLLISKSMAKMTGTTSLEALIPVCSIAGAMSGTLGAGLALPFDRDNGLLSRLWIMPVHRASALTGTLLAEAIRTLAGTVLILAVGYGLGFRFDGSWLAVLVYLLVPVLVVVVYATIVITIALRPRGPTVLIWVGTGCMGLAFASIAPPEIMPAAIRPLAKFQPLAPTVDAMRALSHGDPALWSLLLTVVWALALAAVFGPLAVRGYRAAAESAA